MLFLRHNDSPLYIKRAPHGLFLNHFHAATAAWSLITATTRLSAFRYRDFTPTFRVGTFVRLAFFIEFIGPFFLPPLLSILLSFTDCHSVPFVPFSYHGNIGFPFTKSLKFILLYTDIAP